MAEWKTIQVATSHEGKVVTVTLNRPTKKNAYNLEMYEEVTRVLRETDAKKSVSVLVLTGKGNFYSSGNDLSVFLSGDPQALVISAKSCLSEFVTAFIEFSKILVCAVNGPVLGIAATTLGLADFVYATESSWLQCPFMKLGQSPEGCSSYTFPRKMGEARANEILLLGRRFSATEAFESGLYSAVFPDASFASELALRVDALAVQPIGSLLLSKKLIRELEIPILKDAHRREVALLEERWVSDECSEAILNFFQSKSRL